MKVTPFNPPYPKGGNGANETGTAFNYRRDAETLILERELMGNTHNCRVNGSHFQQDAYPAET